MIREVGNMTIEVTINDPSQKSMPSIKHLSFNNNNPKKTQVSSWGDCCNWRQIRLKQSLRQLQTKSQELDQLGSSQNGQRQEHRESFREREKLRNIIFEELEDGVIRAAKPGEVKFLSPVHVVPKKGGKWRKTLD
ncbi:MAG: hypothetical protein EZS28_009020, partial [Streblomastix strix]